MARNQNGHDSTGPRTHAPDDWVPVICPVCRGSKLRYNPETVSWGPDPCIACGGSGEGPRGSEVSPELRERQRVARAEFLRHRKEAKHRRRTGWSKAEDRYILRQEAEWRMTAQETGRIRRPGSWYHDLVADLAERFGSIRTAIALKARIKRLVKGEI
jgi:hypothetical protein